jgi:hypothetical protein
MNGYTRKGRLLSMKRRTYMIASVISVTLAAVGFLYFSSRDSSTSLSSKTSRMGSNDAAEVSFKKESNLLRKKKALQLKALRQKRFFLKEEPEIDELQDFLDASGYTLEEWREVSRIMQESGPYFGDMGAETLESMLQSQESDPNWTSSIEKEASKTMEYEEALGTDLVAVDCRETLCRLDFHHKDGAAYRRYYGGKMDRGSWISGASNSFGSINALEDGSVDSILYFTKKDQGETFLKMRKNIIARVNNRNSE